MTNYVFFLFRFMMNKNDRFRTRISRYLRRTHRWMRRKRMKDHSTFKISFIHNGQFIQDYDTPIHLQMNNGSIISIVGVEKIGDENETSSQDTVIL